MRLVCQEGLLPGADRREKFHNGRSYGFDGIEIGGRGLKANLKEYQELAHEFGLRWSAEYITVRFGGGGETLIVAGILFGVTLALIGLWAGARAASRADHLETWFAIGALALLYGSTLIMVVPGGMTPKRLAHVALPLVIMSGVWAMRRWRPTLYWGALALSIVGLVALGVAPPKQPWRQVVSEIHASMPQAAQRVVLVSPHWEQAVFEFYNLGVTPSEGLAPAGLGEDLMERLGRFDEIWLISAGERFEDPDGEILRWLGERFELASTDDFYEMMVLRFRPFSPG